MRWFLRKTSVNVFRLEYIVGVLEVITLSLFFIPLVG